jgi:ATP-binding cassette subfamily B protein
MMMIVHGGLTGGLLLCISLLTGYKVLCKVYTIGDFILLNSYIISFSESINQLGKHIKNLREGVVDLQGIYEIFNETQDSTLSNETNAGNHEISPEDTAISFKDISFSYRPESPLLNNISFDIYHGKTVAIVGASGSGKSTITKLLLRLYQPTQGEITIGGLPLKEIELKNLRSKIGIVPQNPVLFRDTIFNNIAYANPLAPFEEVKTAAKTARIDDFITKLPEKYETELGELGMTISGGERQRIALARALLKKPFIFIFDEATSALDTHTEAELMHSIVDASKNKTTLMIAHRLSTIMHADHIIVLDHGKIKEQGTHTQLLELNKLYAQLWYKQESTHDYC